MDMHAHTHTPLKWTQQLCSDQVAPGDLDDLQLTFNSFTSLFYLHLEANDKMFHKVQRV